MLTRPGFSAASLAIALSTADVRAAEAQSPSAPRGRSEVVANAKAATVTLQVTAPDRTVSGSGFLAGSNGVVVTAFHLISGANSVEVHLSTGETFSAQGVLHADSTLDLAILKLDADDLPALALGGSDDLEIGHRLLVISSPPGGEPVVSDGMLSTARLIRGRKVFRISVPSAPDNSGGPVVTESGKVVGMVVAGMAGDGGANLSSVLPAGYIREIIRLVETRTPTPFIRRTGPLPQLMSRRTPAMPVGDVPPIVNDSLDIDYRVLDGAELATEEFKTGEYERYTHVKYSLSTDVAGEPILERALSMLTRAPNPVATYSTIDFAKVDERSQMRIDFSKTELFLQQAALSEHARKVAGNIDIIIADTVASLNSSFKRTYSKWVPRGVIAAPLQNSALAALPDSLPPQVFLWTVAIDTVGTRLMPSRFRFGREVTMKVPIAKRGKSCTDKKVRFTKMKVRPVTETTGAVSTRYHVLSARPHLRFDEWTTCLRLPPRPKR